MAGRLLFLMVDLNRIDFSYLDGWIAGRLVFLMVDLNRIDFLNKMNG
jgi:hypothetical protein